MLISYQESDYRTAWHSKQRHFRTAKTGEYMMTLDAETLLWLNRYFLESRPAEAVRRNHGVFFCEHRPGCDDHGAPIHIATVRYLFQSLAKSVSDGGSGIHVTPHMLRHTGPRWPSNRVYPERWCTISTGSSIISEHRPILACESTVGASGAGGVAPNSQSGRQVVTRIPCRGGRFVECLDDDHWKAPAWRGTVAQTFPWI
jgi:hypothetical protein